MNKELKVRDAGDYYLKERKPSIKLEGKWLGTAGFSDGDTVDVEILSAGELHIKKKESVE